jgi:DNA-binding response OmpR family regulator
MSLVLKDKTLLIIEDDENSRESACRLFQSFVNQIYYAHDTISAMKILQFSVIDCIVCDILLGQEDGLELIRNIREYDEFIPIIVISGHVSEDYLMRAIPLNLVAYLRKPIEYTSFLHALRICSKRMVHKNNLIHITNHYYYDIALKVIKKENKLYKLHQKEILFMEMVIKNRNNIITKDMFYEFVWQYQDMSDSALKNFILRIRRRFGKDFIESVNNIGYRLCFFV